MLLFRVGEERWAIAASQIQDVIPLVNLQKTPYSCSVAAGLLNYHGDLLTAVDVSQLIRQKAVPQAMSTRIIVVQKINPLSTQPATEGKMHRLALLVAQASEMANVSKVTSEIAQHRYAEAMLQMDSGEAVQQLAIAPIFEQLHRLHPFQSVGPIEHQLNSEQINGQLNGVS